MPRTVTAGRAQSMSETRAVAEQRDARRAAPASLRNCSGGYGAPVQVCVLSSPVIGGVAARVAQRGQHRDQRGQRVGGGAAEHAGVHLGGERLDRDDDVDHAAQADGRGRVARPRRCRCRRPGSRRRAAGRRCSGTNASRPPVPCSSEPSTTSFRLTGTSSPSARSAVEVHDDVALAVGGAAAVPAAVDLGQLERRGAPGVVVERRLHVVVGVEQHRRRVRVARTGRDPTTALLPSAVSLEVRVGEAELARTCRAPTAAARSHSSGGNCRGSATDRMATSSASSSRAARHQLGDALRAGPSAQSLATSSVLRSSTNSWKSSSSSGQ